MNQLYTCGTWTVVPGREDDFVAAWSDLARWTSEAISGSGWATLLQHHEKPNVFVSFGPWDSAEAVEAWRASPGFQERIGRIRALLEDFEPGLFERRVQLGEP
jgi:heme-degrading monooxygenase HmoA